MYILPSTKEKNSSSSMLSFKIETRSCKPNLYVTDHFRNQNSLNVDVMKFRWFLDIIFSNHKVTDFEINSYNSFYYAQHIDFKRCEDSRYTNPNVSLILISVGQNDSKIPHNAFVECFSFSGKHLYER